MMNNPPPLQGLNIRIPSTIPIKGRGVINHGSTLGFTPTRTEFLKPEDTSLGRVRVRAPTHPLLAHMRVLQNSFMYEYHAESVDVHLKMFIGFVPQRMHQRSDVFKVKKRTGRSRAACAFPAWRVLVIFPRKPALTWGYSLNS